jgi:hypothetical protein
MAGGHADCIARQLLREFSDSQSEISLESTNSPQVKQEKFLSAMVDTKSSVFAVLPEGECEFKAVHRNATPSQPALAEIDRTRTQLRQLAKTKDNIEVREAYGKVEFQTFIKNTRSDFVFIIGHNESGNFRFSDGNALSLSEMAEGCYEASKRCIFLSCQAASYVPHDRSAAVVSRISYNQALNTVTIMRRFLEESQGKVSYRQVASELGRVEKHQVRIQYITKAGQGAGIVATALIVGYVAKGRATPTSSPAIEPPL